MGARDPGQEADMPYDLESDYRWFKANRAELYQRYPERFLVIRDKVVLGDYADDWSALQNSPFPLGEYLLQECLGSPEAYVQRIYSPFLVATGAVAQK